MQEPSYILKNETTGINGERIILYYFTSETDEKESFQKKAYGIGIDMYTQDYGMRTTRERKIIDRVFLDKRDAESFLNIICKCCVTPTSLADVIYDYISELPSGKNAI